MTTLLAIETSCDETAAAVVEDGRYVHSNIVASQVEIHQKYGGVVPELASRQHIKAIVPVVTEAMVAADVAWEELDGIAVTYGPGLAGALLVGVNFAKALAFSLGVPLIGVNHLEGHVYAAWLSRSRRARRDVEEELKFPLLALVVSGGHTELVLMRGHGDYGLIGATRDDAAGEAFDKVGRILGLPFPGGPAVQLAAEQLSRYGLRGRRNMVDLPRAWMQGTYEFSFSGVKTAVLRYMQSRMKDQDLSEPLATSPGGIVTTDVPLYVAQVAASFQQSVSDVLVAKTVDAAREFKVQMILVVGGVAANSLLREEIVAHAPVPVRIPDFAFCTDNAAMIGACGYYRLQQGLVSDMTLDVDPGARLAPPSTTIPSEGYSGSRRS
ncbi:MAG: tRNA (adenosine(37)-N6)-threonylcarbamoyltransferase complex transferase subunit TsaD [Chloroflexota bacterium]|nr:tRNA (adenosine(37)-N6)-threonylcarbamoyltransferase complex transferase subunit TsaD [Chloroflexota bacterium]MDE2930480.1 tRNA (adenosine(37)-N6)-threonylcarbamoyltransferase complex transferase subunit TsaD [Chloroflexota bacterium]